MPISSLLPRVFASRRFACLPNPCFLLAELELDEDLFEFPVELHGLYDFDDFERLDLLKSLLTTSLESATDTVLLGGPCGGFSFTAWPSTFSKSTAGKAAASSSVGSSGLCRGASGAV